MALTLIPETGAGVADANTYATRAEGDAYHEARLHGSDWTNADPGDRDKALAMATRFLDANVTWRGQRMEVDQALSWPRSGVSWDGHNLRKDVLPKPVKDATIELARLLLASDLQAQQTSDNIKSLGLGSGALKVEFKDSSVTQRMPIAIDELLQGLGRTRTQGTLQQHKVTR